MNEFRRWFLGISAVALFGILGGCGGGVKNAPARVSGKVTYKGAAVSGGTIVFWTTTGPYQAALTADGTYSIIDAPAEEAVVTVDTESINPSLKQQDYGGGKGKGPGMPGGGAGGGARKSTGSPMPDYAKKTGTTTYVKIPSKYGKKESSTLKLTLSAGDQKKDFELTD